MDFELPLWFIFTLAISAAIYPILILAGGTAIISLIVAAVAKSAFALKVAGIAAAVFFSPLVLGIVLAPIITVIEAIDQNVSDSPLAVSFGEWKENTPLIRAVKKQNEQKVEKLLKKGKDVNETSKYGERTPLSVSCNAYADEEKADRITKMLLEAGADANKEFNHHKDAMENAVIAKRHGAIKILCDHGYKREKDDGSGRGIVEFAVQTKRYEEAVLLLELGFIPCERYDFGFMREEFTIFLYVFSEPIFYEMDESDIEKNAAALNKLFSLLIERGADVNAIMLDFRGATPINAWGRACEANRWDSSHKILLAKQLLDAGADVNAKDSNDSTALHYFAKIPRDSKFEEIRDTIQLLVSYGADKTEKDSDGRTALDVFHKRCSEEEREKNRELYDEIERLLTPEKQATEQPKEPPKVSESAKSNEIRIAKAEPKESELKRALHLPLSDMMDDW